MTNFQLQLFVFIKELEQMYVTITGSQWGFKVLLVT